MHLEAVFPTSVLFVEELFEQMQYCSIHAREDSPTKHCYSYVFGLMMSWSAWSGFFQMDELTDRTVQWSTVYTCNVSEPVQRRRMWFTVSSSTFNFDQHAWSWTPTPKYICQQRGNCDCIRYEHR